MITQCINKVNNVLYATNIYISRWFRQLIDLAEKGWDIEKAVDITMKLIPAEYLQASIDIMKDEKEKLFKELGI